MHLRLQLARQIVQFHRCPPIASCANLKKAKAKAAKTPEELMALVKEEGIELTDEQLESVSGGWSLTDCPSVCTDNQEARECTLLAGHM